MSYYLHYQDDGPAGPCGQSMDVTMPQNKLMRFSDEDDARHYVRMTEQHGNGRRRPRFTGWREEEIEEMSWEWT